MASRSSKGICASNAMKALQLAAAGDRLSILCLGAHSDDIEIGAGATLLSMIGTRHSFRRSVGVLSGAGERGAGGEGIGSGFSVRRSASAQSR